MEKDNCLFSIQMENIKLKQKVNYLESRQKHNMNCSEKMKINSEKQHKNEKTSSVKTNGTANEKAQENNKMDTNEKQARNEVIIVGDSIIKNIDPRGLSRRNKTSVKSYSGATSQDMIDFVKPAARRRPVLDNFETKSILESLLNIAKVIHSISSETKVSFSSIVKRNDDVQLNIKVNEVNKLLKESCVELGYSYIDNDVVEFSCLSRSGLHLNHKKDAFLAKNLNSHFKFLAKIQVYT